MSELQILEMSSLKTNLQDALKEVFSATFGDIPEFIETENPAKGMSAIIGISDGISGFLALHVSSEDACKIASAMLGDSYQEVDDIVFDAIGELANMVGGSLKKYSSRYGEPFKISVPTIVRGNDYETHVAKDAQKSTFSVRAISVCFHVQLVIYSR